MRTSALPTGAPAAIAGCAVAALLPLLVVPAASAAESSPSPSASATAGPTATATPSGSPGTTDGATCGPGAVELVTTPVGSGTAGSDHVQGYVARRVVAPGAQCVAPGVTVRLYARDAGTRAYRLVRTGTTDRSGRVQFRVRPPHDVVLEARSAATSAYPAATSVRTTVLMATRVTLAIASKGKCAVAVRGASYPVARGARVVVSRVTSSGNAVIGRVPVDGRGRYAATLRVPCGDRAPITAAFPRTGRNAAGVLGQPEAPTRSLRSCGSVARGSAPSGLVQRFVPFNTTTAVGGLWWGERVIANPTDKPVTYRSGGFSTSTPYQLSFRGALVGREGMTDAGTSTETTVAPGEELREVLYLEARNCFRSDSGGFVTRAGAPLPKGTYGATTLVRGLGSGRPDWASAGAVLTVS